MNPTYEPRCFTRHEPRYVPWYALAVQTGFNTTARWVHASGECQTHNRGDEPRLSWLFAPNLTAIRAANGLGGHFVKMAYHLMLELGMTQKEMAQQFDKWNNGVLDSFLIEITRDILNYEDDEGYNGFMLLREAANEYKWNLKYGGIVCKPTLFYLLLDNFFKNQQSLREVVSQADYFLAHTYELLGKEGKFVHTNWTPLIVVSCCPFG
ncbi:6-phosphogluconate dehydrogenase [Culex quinquefasciatus]|uniref:phosphogluconate dehydrogenase (NADP(+)-dependent, decarboxylating) n=1 Tax=Culex quinquefasciatus TaxID=7176 RepID=B0X096_CULQU|nr:6-phosphogluconate dehydrogenase [Culex quinquefasciatus]|eukprot:XP_001863068.1 6-phosphogluconate dehydrogenase [Culex quinquefasciatus]